MSAPALFDLPAPAAAPAAAPATFRRFGITVLSYGLGADSTALLLMFLAVLAEIERDLVLRRKRAEEEQWLGEIEGIDMTLTFVRTKQADAARTAARTTVLLGLPGTRHPSG
ncbi:hypothetical protein ACFY1J_05520 [Streptomyces sp. NPDC001406]|uniref:hypothetical protein n=1 Tax=Streptomyces sp. NPDC001406 TaxID=3364572 RepID=UPI0036A54D94